MIFYKKLYRIGKFRISNVELEHLFRAWFAISLAFAIAMTSPLSKIFTPVFLFNFILAAVTVGVGFILHEMGHKVVAQRYGCLAEFRANNQMLIFAVIISFTHVIFAAPGAVLISGHINTKQNGKIAAAGPMMSLAAAFVFLVLMLSIHDPLVMAVSYYGLLINSWIALFNLLPFPIFDGLKILAWDKLAYGIMLALAALMMFFQGLVGEAMLAGASVL